MITFINPKNVSTILLKFTQITFWVPILSDYNKHYSINRISSIYIYCDETGEEFMVGFNSNDLENVDPELFFQFLPDGERFCVNHLHLDSYKFIAWDAGTLYWYNKNTSLFLEKNNQDVFGIYNNWYKDLHDINDAIPIMKILEYCRKLKDKFFQTGYEMDRGHYFYQTMVAQVLSKVEKNGIRVYVDKVEEHYGFKPHGNVIYSKYNYHTMTGRPSNRSDQIPLSSMNKSDGSREVIISRYPDGRLFEFDYDSYQIRIIASMIDFKLPDGNMHENFAKIYFPNHVMTPDLYKKSKDITWQELYGTETPKYDIDFFHQVKKFKDDSWNECIEQGYFSSPLAERKFKMEWYDDMHKSKMFNYMIASYETEANMIVLDKILQYLLTKKTKIIMYTYDAFLFDHDPSEGMQVMKDIRDLLTRFGCPVHTKVGLNYNDMIEVTTLK